MASTQKMADTVAALKADPTLAKSSSGHATGTI
jgi:hypothetical protein